MTRSLGLTLVFVLASSAHADAQKIITFDAPGADTTPGDNNGTYPAGINRWGAVTGSYQGADEVNHGFLRSPEGAFTTFDVPEASLTPYYGTFGASINALGVIAGGYYDASGFEHGFLRRPDGTFTTFDVPGAGGYGTNPIAINLEGAVVGYYTDSNYSFRAFLRRSDGTFATWAGPGACTGNGSVGCYGSSASNINLLGTVAGSYADADLTHHAYVRNALGELKAFEVPGAGTGDYQGTGCPGCAVGLNVFGEVAGSYSDTNYVSHGFLRSSSGMITTFDSPGAGSGSFQGTGCPSDCSTSLNDEGAITGTYIDSSNNYHGYLRSPRGEITTIDPVNTIGTYPSGINDPGIVVGEYIDSNDVYHGFLWIPDRWLP